MRYMGILLIMTVLLTSCNGESQKYENTVDSRPKVEKKTVDVLFSLDGSDRSDEKNVPAHMKLDMPEDGFDYTFEAKGKRFGTFVWTLFGNNDIWLAFSEDGGKYTAVFTGCTMTDQALPESYNAAYNDGRVVISYEEAINRGEDFRRARLEKSLEWLRRDSDSDGLTDLVEYRFMLNPAVADTDYDGKKDGDDGNPLEPAGDNLHEEQEVWKAAFAKFNEKMEYLNKGELLIAVFEREADFFELEGWPLQVLSLTEESLKAYREDIGFGTRCVFFKEITWGTSDEGNRTATFEIQEFSGPLQARGVKLTLEKMDGEWLIVKSQIEWQA